MLVMILSTCISLNLNAQQILAGQTSGENIYYFDIDDIDLVLPYNQSVGDDIDIDGGGWDLYFNAFQYEGHSGSSWGTDVTPNGSTSISTLEEEPDWVQKYDYGDTIHPYLVWWNSMGILRWGSSSSVQGIFTGEGYLAFRIESPDLIYGWVRIYVSYGQMTIYEYAFYSETYVGIDARTNDEFNIKFQNPIRDRLEFSFDPQYKSCNYNYKLFNSQGGELLQGDLYFGNNTIEMRTQSSGLLFLLVTNQNGSSRSYKIIKY